MNECGYRQTYLANYLLVQDLDEFVVPSVADSWSAMLDHAHSTMSSPAADRVASYSFRNSFFPLQFPDDVDQASTKAGFKGGWAGGLDQGLPTTKGLVPNRPYFISR